MQREKPNPATLKPSFLKSLLCLFNSINESLIVNGRREELLLAYFDTIGA